MADKAEKDLEQASDCGWVRGLDANGNPIKISKDYLASVIASQIELDRKNIRKTITLKQNEIINFGVKGGLIVINTISFQEQCLVLFSCYGEWEGSVNLLSKDNIVFIVGSKATETINKLVVYREDSTSSCYLKNTYSVDISIAYQIMGGFW